MPYLTVPGESPVQLYYRDSGGEGRTPAGPFCEDRPLAPPPCKRNCCACAANGARPVKKPRQAKPRASARLFMLRIEFKESTKIDRSD